MSRSVYRGAACPDCGGGGRVDHCPECHGAGTLPCDLCAGHGLRRIHRDGEPQTVPCVCERGYFACARCSGGTGVCGTCGGGGLV